MSREVLGVAAVVALTLAGCSATPEPSGASTRVTVAPATSPAPEPPPSASTTKPSASAKPSSTKPSSTAAGGRPLVPGPRITAEHTAKAPTIDGSDRDWPARPAYTVDQQVGGKDRTTARASWRLGWNSNTLFVFVKVTDPDLTQTHLQRPWLIGTGDAVGLELGTYTTRIATDRMGARDVRILIAPTETGGTLRALAYPEGANFAAGTTWTTGAAIAKRTVSGYVVEAAIPFETLRVEKPRAGMKLAANLLLADAVATGAKRGSLGALLSNNEQRRGSGAKWRFTWGVLELST